MAVTSITKVGAFTDEVATQINDNFSSVSTGGTLTNAVLVTSTATTSFNPTVSDGTTLGSTAKQFSDLFLAEGGVINWDNGDATITQANNVLTVAGAALTTTGADLTTPVLTGTITGTYTLGGTPTLASAAGVPYVGGIAASYRLARGVHQQVAASDTVVTGLTTVVAVVVSFQSAPTVKQLYAAGSIGNQSGAPAAGSILINSYKPTAVDNCTPTAATDFSENINFGWIAIGT